MPKRFRQNDEPKLGKDEAVKAKIKAMIEKTQKLQQQRQREADLLKVQQEKLQSLLCESEKIDAKKLKNEIKNIGIKYKECIRDQRNKRKEECRIRREERKREKEEIKKRKQEYYAAINNVIIDKLPSSKIDINGSNILNIYIDNMCRKKIKRSKINEFIHLLNKIHLNLNYDYDININCWFHGIGVNEKRGNVQIEFTGKEINFNDKLINKLNKIENKNKCNLVITSDRDLMYRLSQTGVCFVMRSKTFYKTYLNENENENENDNNNDIDAELAKHIAMKINIDNNNNNNNNKMVQDNEDDYTFNDDDDDNEFDENMDENVDENMDENMDDNMDEINND